MSAEFPQRTKVGRSILLTFRAPAGYDIRVHVMHETREDVSTSAQLEEKETPEGFDSIYTYRYTPLHVGWYLVSFRIDGVDDATDAGRFFAFRTVEGDRTVGTISSRSSSRRR